ncbi:TPA: hypothetical protein U2Q16_000918 [Citrobacter koseri]|nr:hypothetical protein [Citrobacter koseri]
MTELDLRKLSKKALLQLISEAANELHRRESSSSFVEPAAAEETALSPGQADLVFINNCLNASDYVHADAKDRYKQLASKYSEWFAYKGYPRDLRGSDLKKWKQYFRPNTREQ